MLSVERDEESTSIPEVVSQEVTDRIGVLDTDLGIARTATTRHRLRTQ
jgi:hypothetical protein